MKLSNAAKWAIHKAIHGSVNSFEVGTDFFTNATIQALARKGLVTILFSSYDRWATYRLTPEGFAEHARWSCKTCEAQGYVEVPPDADGNTCPTCKGTGFL